MLMGAMVGGVLTYILTDKECKSSEKEKEKKD